MNERPSSARQRLPQSGRSNVMSQGVTRPRSAFVSRPSNTDEAQFSDNSLRVKPSIFNPSRFPTNPPAEIPKPRKLPLTCPQSWMDKCAERNWVVDNELVTNVDLNMETKENMTRKFVSRNKTRLWRMNVNYLDKSPQELFNDLKEVEDRKFVPLMRRLHTKERILNLSGSERLGQCFNDHNQTPVYQNSTDPFMMSLTTSRESKASRMERILAPVTTNIDKRFNRGHRHLPDEYGNFSTFNGILKMNKETMLDR